MGKFTKKYKGESSCPKICPFCQADLRGPCPNPGEVYKKWSTFGRALGLYSEAEERVIIWECPDCNNRWCRDDKWTKTI